MHDLKLQYNLIESNALSNKAEPFNSQIKFLILLIVNHTILSIMLVQRI